MSRSPVLNLLGNYGEKGLKRFVRGVEVEKLLQGRYSNLVDLLPDTETACLSDAVVGDRAPLTHRRLRQFIQNEFDLGAFGLNKGDRVGVLLPNGPELALTILAVVSNWCAAPINPTNSSAEIRAEVLSTRSRAIIILAGSLGSEAAIEAVQGLPVGVIVVTPTGGAAGLVHLKSHSQAHLTVPVTAAAAQESSPEREGETGLPPSPSSSSSSSSSSAPTASSPTHAARRRPIAKGSGSKREQQSETPASPTPAPTPAPAAASALPVKPTGPGSRVVLLLHTSGTSGNKKLVPYTLDTVVVGAASIVASWNLGPTDVCLNMMPLFHIGGIMRNVFAPILAGGQTIACTGFDPLLFWDVAAARSFSWYYAAPTMHHAILAEAERRPSPLPSQTVRYIANAAGALLPALALALKKTFPNAVILTSYGMTECMPISTPPQDYALDPTGTSGIPVGPDVKIVDDDMKPCAEGVAGNIMVRGTPCFYGYETDPNNSGASSVNDESFFFVDGEPGWFNTGDVGSMDRQGYLFISGRSKEIINRGGETISPFEIEEAVVKHPSVKETIAFSTPHDQFQETVGAVIVTKPGEQRLDLPSLHKYLEDKLHRSKWPQVLVFLDALPKNQTGKLLRVKLADRFKMKEISDETRPLARLFEGKCPPVGTPLTTPIPINTVNVSEAEALCVKFLATEQKAYRVLRAAAVRLDLPFRPDALVAFVVLRHNSVATSPTGSSSSSSSASGSISAGARSAREESLLNACVAALPRYAAPAMLLIVEQLPLLPPTSSSSSSPSSSSAAAAAAAAPGGEAVDREALKALAARSFVDQNVVLPRNSIERQVEAVWRAALGASGPVSVLSSFFDLGGDSLKAGQLVNAMRKKLSVQLSVADLFASPTIESLSHKISSLKTLGSPLGSSPPDSSSASAKVKTGSNPNSSSPASRWRRTFFQAGNPSPVKHGGSASTDQLEEASNKYFSYDHASLFSNTSPICLLVQLLPIGLVYPMRKIVIWFLVAGPWVYFMKHGWGRFRALLVAMVVSRLLLGIAMPLLGIAAKWIIIGRYRSGKYPLWGAMYLRWWITEQIVNICGKGFFRDDLPIIGSQMVRLYHVLLGASIGVNVKIHKDAKVGTVADLLVIGDDVTIDNCHVRPFAVEEGHFVLLPIHIGSGSSLGVKTVVAPGTTIPPKTCLGPLSSFPHEAADSDTENRKYCRPAFLQPQALHILVVGIPIILAVNVVAFIPWYIGLTVMVNDAKTNGWYESEIHTVFHAFLWWIQPQRLFYYFLLRIIKRCVVPFLRVGLVILIKRNIIGKFTALTAADKLKPWNRLRYWLMYRLLPGGGLGGVARLVGSHYEIISIIYRALGATVGKRVYWPGSGLEIVEYDLLHVGNDVVFGSRSVVMTSSTSRSAPVTLHDGSMIADRCVLLPGTTLCKGSVLGSGSLAKEDFFAPVGSVWVGSTDGCAVCAAPEDRSYNVKDTSTPFGRAFYDHKASYTVIPLWAVVAYNSLWQAFCTCYRNCPTALSLIICSFVLQFEHYQYHSELDLFVVTLLVFVPLHLWLCATALGVDIAGKWLLLGRREQGAYPWDQSSYCQRWQAYLTLQEIRRGERRKTGILDMLQGSQWLVWYFTLLGSDIGRNVCLYPNGGDPMMTEPDLVTIGDGCVIDDASLIAHINTRGIFRLNPVTVAKCCVLKSMTRLLSGACMEPYSILQEHTLVLAGESVDVGSVWQGWPSSGAQRLEDYRAALRRHLEVILHHQARYEEADVDLGSSLNSSHHNLLALGEAAPAAATERTSVARTKSNSFDAGTTRSPLLSAGADKPHYSSVSQVELV